MKIKIALGVSLFLLGLFYIGLENQVIGKKSLQPEKFNTFYAVTGDNHKTVEILKCLDEKSIKHTFENNQAFQEVEEKLKQECLEDWLNKEIRQTK